ncbi:activator-dependent family glycosyltransferase [Actinosynnema sp. NPDC047251]|uniref:Glycosyltransferase, family 1 n=1 Tax=Saccharothrix espanaensis (strain ATCC 51144 / DSM 44229 / JCM 9112 / NBRC 15066 / NRRL 15764) TaxID=1179773 RepID=K0K6K8_SACES|nr:activator-dependent family glycosyltransferase [Saccharothrix espanaensis]CCH33137.1 Glycosyltransferase, family 1 [Saccharothrix espanaensis DSM 44229]
MRVLLAANPDKSMFLSLVPLAWALHTAGHEVRVAGQPHFAATITQAGLTAVPVGRDRDLFQVLRHTGVSEEMMEETRVGLPTPYDCVVPGGEDIGWEEFRDGYALRVTHWHRLDNFPIITGLVEFARAWKPDLVIWEALTYAGAIAAKACGAAHARLLWSIDVFGATRELFLKRKAAQPVGEQADPPREWLDGYARRYGFEFSEDMVTGQFTLDPLPASLRVAADLHYVPMRYIPYGGPATVPDWLRVPPERPRVALTLGTTATERFGGYAVRTQDVLDALADLDVEVVATIAESEQRKLTRVPDNTRVVSYVPLHALVPTCAAVINHAGPGTFLTTAVHGVPQLTVPWDFDEPELARRAARQGASLMIRADQATGPAIRAGLLRVLGEPSFRARAERLRDDIRALPSPNELVPRLEQLTADYRIGG